MIPRKLRRSEEDISYLAVRSLSHEATEGLISRLLRGRGFTVSENSLEKLIQLSDSHPFNVYRMVDEVADCGVNAFLANPSTFVDWKHRQSSEYIEKIMLDELEVQILAILKLVPELDFTSIVEALELDDGAASDAMLRMVNLHVLESTNESFILSPPLRVAIERDSRFRLKRNLEQRAISTLADSLSIRLGEGTAPVVLINATILTSLQSGGGDV